MRRLNTLRTARGFSLVEVMVAVVIICVGLLGIAKLQALSMSSTTTSRQRALAAMQAASIASAMHSNREYWAGDFQLSAAAPSVTLSGAGPTAAVVSTDAAMATAAQTQARLANPAQNINSCNGVIGTTAACNDRQLASFDLARWWAVSVAPMLPNAVANITCDPAVAGTPAPNSCRVRLQWSERAVALNAQSAAANASFEVPTYLLYVEP